MKTKSRAIVNCNNLLDVRLELVIMARVYSNLSIKYGIQD